MIYFFFNDTATTEIYTLSLHDALPIFMPARSELEKRIAAVWTRLFAPAQVSMRDDFFLELGGHSLLAARMVSELRSEEHTSELQSRLHLVCRLLLEKKNNSTISLCSIL